MNISINLLNSSHDPDSEHKSSEVSLDHNDGTYINKRAHSARESYGLEVLDNTVETINLHENPVVRAASHPLAYSDHNFQFNDEKALQNILDDALSSDSDSLDDDCLRSVDVFSSDSEDENYMNFED